MRELLRIARSVVPVQVGDLEFVDEDGDAPADEEEDRIRKADRIVGRILEQELGALGVPVVLAEVLASRGEPDALAAVEIVVQVKLNIGPLNPL